MPDEGLHLLKPSDCFASALTVSTASGSAAVPSRDGARRGARLPTTLGAPGFAGTAPSKGADEPPLIGEP
jgi:hypothetical protein